MKHLLAKSGPAGFAPTHSATVLGHLQAVTAAAQVVTELSGPHQLTALGLSQGSLPALERCVMLAAALHDLGKMNSAFQEMLRGDHLSQPIRHEFVSWYLVTCVLNEWLAPVRRSALETLAVDCAIVGHHRRTDCLGKGEGASVRLFLSHQDALAVLRWLSELLKLSPPPNLSDRTLLLVGVGSPSELFEQWCRKTDRAFQRLGSEERRFVAAVKASLIGADVAGSALRTTSIRATLAKWLHNLPGRKNLQRVVDQRLNGSRGKRLRHFQERVRDSQTRVTLVRAGCGTGKTLAAYAWAATQHSDRRLYFCYPTTGTATEGYRGYLLPEHSALEARLFHSRAEVDLELILGVGADEDDDDATLRVESLRAWAAPIVACTTDTVLGLMENSRSGLYAWPALANAAFVFDEIHSYDDRLFNALVAFLHDLPGLPVLLMTASLQMQRLQQLRDVIGIAEIEGEVELEQRPRYQRATQQDEFEAASSFLSNNKKVLWVCNTVDRARDTADRMGSETKLYHSRYRYCDRVDRHREVVSAFESVDGKGALAVCTQVAEMSLDLSADLLITELASVPALIQRLGRLARWIEQGDSPGEFLIIEPPGALPYSVAELEEARAWLKQLGSSPLSQSDLAEAWTKSADSRPIQLNLNLNWQCGGAHTVPGQIRDGGAGIAVLLSTDEAGVRDGSVPISSVLVPMLRPKRQHNWRSWKRVRGFPVAPLDLVNYDARRGAAWR